MVSLNSFTSKSDQSLNSPYNITPESHIKVTKIKEMITVAEYIWTKISNGYIAFCNLIMQSIIAKLAGRSPIIIQNSSNHQAEKNLDVRPYKVLLLTCVVNCTAGTPTPRLCPVVSALGSESDDPGSSPGWGKALCPWNVRGKNASSAFRLG